MEKEEFRIEVALNEDRTRTKLGLPPTLETSSDGLSQLVDILGKVRAQMAPAFVDAPPTGKLQALADPPNNVGQDPSAERVTLSICHPSYGWLNLALSREATDSLIERLVTARGNVWPPAATMH